MQTTRELLTDIALQMEHAATLAYVDLDVPVKYRQQAKQLRDLVARWNNEEITAMHECEVGHPERGPNAAAILHVLKRLNGTALPPNESSCLR